MRLNNVSFGATLVIKEDPNKGENVGNLESLTKQGKLKPDFLKGINQVGEELKINGSSDFLTLTFESGHLDLKVSGQGNVTSSYTIKNIANVLGSSPVEVVKNAILEQYRKLGGGKVEDEATRLLHSLLKKWGSPSS